MSLAAIEEPSRSALGAAEPRKPRVIGRFRSSEPGPTLICTAAVHGNEPAGYGGLERVFAQLAADDSILRGDLIGLLGNRQALSAGTRFIDCDLNRSWFPDRIEAARRGVRHFAEDEELAGLDREFSQAIDRARGPVFLLDLHTTSGPGPAFVVLDDSLTNRQFGRVLPGPIVLGLEEELGGTLLNYAEMRGITGASFECGSHEDPVSVDQAEEAIWIALGRAGLLKDDSVLQRYWDRQARRLPLPEVVEVAYRHGIEAGNGFRMDPDFESFQPVSKGQRLASADEGPIFSKMNGWLLMPLYQPQGDDGFFIVKEVAPVWLEVSKVVRRWPLGRALSWLPGIRRDPDHSDSLIVDRSVARWLVAPLFHLLGYRREVARDGRFLVVTRRSTNDTELKG